MESGEQIDSNPNNGENQLNESSYSQAEVTDQDESGWAHRPELQCRFYRNEWPELHSIVVVSISRASLINTSFRSKLSKWTRLAQM